MLVAINGLLFWCTDNAVHIYTYCGRPAFFFTRHLDLVYEYWPGQTDRNVGIGRTKQTKMGLTARPNRPDVDIGQTKQAKMCVLARPNRPKSNKINVVLKNFPLHLLIQNLSDNSNTFQCYVCIYLKSVRDKKSVNSAIRALFWNKSGFIYRGNYVHNRFLLSQFWSIDVLRVCYINICFFFKFALFEGSARLKLSWNNQEENFKNLLLFFCINLLKLGTNE